MATSPSFQIATEQFAELGVDVEAALAQLALISISLQCWQGDDVGGFEYSGQVLGGGLAVTGNYPGKARTPDELRRDAAFALKLIPGRHRFNLHASYRECSRSDIGRDELEIDHFRTWIDWAIELGIGLDFNPTFFSHPLAGDGLTLAHADPRVRAFWIRHGVATRRIASAFGKKLGGAAVHNIWIPDGMKDNPVDRLGPRHRLLDSLDHILAEQLPPDSVVDCVEAKLFGIGSEAYVVGSHEFYLGYAARKQISVCLDSGHFHPTESVADKISSILLFVPTLLLHVSRGLRWDSDHVVVLDDQLLNIMREVVRGSFLSRVRIGLDYFDASINRVAAWVIGMRATQKALLIALLEPIARMREAELSGDFTARLAWSEASVSLPWSVVWNEFLTRNGIPNDSQWIRETQRYEREVMRRRI